MDGVDDLRVLVAGVAHRDVAVAAASHPAPRRRARPTDPDRQFARRRARCDTHLGVVEEVTPVSDVAAGERAADRIETLVENGAPPGKLDAQGSELSLDVTCSDAEDGPVSGELGQGPERAGRDQRVPVGGDPNHRQQSDLLGHCSQPGQSGYRVIPGGAHVGGVVIVRYGHVVTHADEVEASRLSSLGHRDQLRGTSVVLPRVDQGAGQSLDGQLDPVDRLTFGYHVGHRSSPPRGGQDGTSGPTRSACGVEQGVGPVRVPLADRVVAEGPSQAGTGLGPPPRRRPWPLEGR